MAFLKLLNHLYTEKMVPRPPTSYQNATAFLYAIGYDWTGREEYLGLVEHMMKAGIEKEGGEPLAKQLKNRPYLRRMGLFRGAYANMHYLLGMPTGMWVLAR